eukprot:7250265-Ditylum_brightwellii.AAC.1
MTSDASNGSYVTDIDQVADTHIPAIDDSNYDNGSNDDTDTKPRADITTSEHRTTAEPPLIDSTNNDVLPDRAIPATPPDSTDTMDNMHTDADTETLTDTGLGVDTNSTEGEQPG